MTLTSASYIEIIYRNYVGVILGLSRGYWVYRGFIGIILGLSRDYWGFVGVLHGF